MKSEQPPTWLGTLTSLTNLCLWHRSQAGGLDQLRRLRQLERLGVCWLNDSVPVQASQLSFLADMSISLVDLSLLGGSKLPALPPGVVSMTQLTALAVGSGMPSGLEGLQQLTTLRAMKLHGCGLSSLAPEGTALSASGAVSGGQPGAPADCEGGAQPAGPCPGARQPDPGPM